jgi:hypothetical protein
MEKCHECGKKQGFMGGYRHPTLGKKYHLCSSCFDKIYQSVENYREFVTPYVNYFHNEPKNDNKIGIPRISEQFTHTIGIYDNI